MTLIERVLSRKAASLVFGGGGGGFTQPPFWAQRPEQEELEIGFESYVDRIYKKNGPVAACIAARAMPFSEARFQYQRLEAGRPTDLFGSPELALLEQPWLNGTTGELLWRMEQDVSLGGNCYLTVVDGRIRRLRPDWVSIISGVRGDPEASAWELNAEVLGYVYEPKPVGQRRPVPTLLTPDQVVHYSVIPDPLAQWRGMSWLTPILREIQGDNAATDHKLNFFRNGATLGVVFSYDKELAPEVVQRHAKLFAEAHAGTDKAYTALHVGGGVDVTTAQSTMQQLEFKATQGAGETRIAAAAGVGAIIARFSEGMAGSSLNQGNYQAAVRQFADMTLRPLWRTAAASLSKFVAVPSGARLWYDVRDVSLLHDSAADEADVLSKNAQSLKALIDAGFSPDAAIRAVDAGDLSLLTGAHSGLYSVQLQPPGSGVAPGGAP